MNPDKSRVRHRLWVRAQVGSIQKQSNKICLFSGKQATLRSENKD